MDLNDDEQVAMMFVRGVAALCAAMITTPGQTNNDIRAIGRAKRIEKYILEGE